MLTIIRRSWRSLTADRTRRSIGLAFAIVGLLFWARLIVIADMPRTAVAEPDNVTAPEAPSRTNDAIDEAEGASDEEDAADAAVPALR